uniref:NADH-ubiquinone oxidoreductase chain 1 n=1 Tax=Coelioxys fenestrata TaxID=621226 RepID=A0A7T5BM86_9HYME|nr:NADH dehydrogenase subunit 1 [Coelioxys fenestrata]QQD78155.1 NADH dehydrogenase subunit 1 [Coelioxys fenestrata]
MIYLNFIYLLILLIMVLIGVAFLTLLERKVLGFIQFRKGPSKVGLMGVLQPFSDAIKLFSKEFFILNKINLIYYMISPMMMLIISIMYWLIYMFYSNLFMMNYGVIYVLMLLSLSVYPVMYGGWASNSMYSLIGGLRSVAQSISFEVSLFMMLFVVLMFVESFSFMDLYKMQIKLKFMFIFFPLYLMIFISMLIELNRVPFDLVEGESELVSGFNTEYYSSNFSMIFMAEYMGVMFMSYMISMFFLNFGYSFIMILIIMFHIYLILWIRGVLPRIRYDELMYLCWKKFLTIVIIYMYMYYLLKMWGLSLI